MNQSTASAADTPKQKSPLTPSALRQALARLDLTLANRDRANRLAEALSGKSLGGEALSSEALPANALNSNALAGDGRSAEPDQPVRVGDCLIALGATDDDLSDPTKLATANKELSSLIKAVNAAAEQADVDVEFVIEGGTRLGTDRTVSAIGVPRPTGGHAHRDLDGTGQRTILNQRAADLGPGQLPLVKVTICFAEADRDHAKELWGYLHEALQTSKRYEYESQPLSTEAVADIRRDAIARAHVLLVLGSSGLRAAGLDSEVGDYAAPSAIVVPLECQSIPILGGDETRPPLHDRQGFRHRSGRPYAELRTPDRKRYATDLASMVYRALEGNPDALTAPDTEADPFSDHDDRHDHHHHDGDGIHPELGPRRPRRLDMDKARHEQGGHEPYETPGSSTAKGLRPEAADAVSVVAIDRLLEWALAPAGENVPLFALLGEAGSGKTVTCQMLDERLEADGTITSHLFDLRDLSRLSERPVPSLDEIMAECMAAGWDDGRAVSPEDLLLRARSEPTLFIFDGLDEALVNYGEGDGVRFVSQLLSICPAVSSRTEADDPNRTNRILVSCRDHFFADVVKQADFLTLSHRQGGTEDRYRAMKLKPLSLEQVERYLANALPERDAAELLATLRQVHDLTDLLTRPFTLAKVVEQLPAIEAAVSEGRTVNAAAVYRAIVSAWLGRDGGKHQVSERHKHRLVPRLAAWAWRQGDRHITVTADRLNEWFWDAIEGDPVLARHYAPGGTRGAEVQQKLEEDLRTATFLVRRDEGDDVGRFRFAHTSFQEYFVAEYLRQAVADDNPAAWTDIDPSRETLAFLGDLLDNDADTDELVATMNRWRTGPGSDADRGEGADEGAGAPTLLLRYALTAHEHGWLGPTLAGFVVHDADLVGWRFEGGDDVPLNLHGLDLRGCSLRDARFSRVRLTGARLDGADLRRATFDRATLANTWLVGADLTGSLWRHCRIDLDSVDTTTTRADGLRLVGPSPVPDRDRPAPHPDRPLTLTAPGHADSAEAVAVRAGIIVSGGSDSTVRVYDSESGECAEVFQGHKGGVSSVGISGDLVVSGSYDTTVRVWGLASGDCLHLLRGHLAAVWSVAIENDVIASSSADGTVRVWDAVTGNNVHTLRGHVGRVMGVAVGGGIIVSGGDDETVRVWDVGSGDLLHTLCGNVGGVTGVAAGSGVVVAVGIDAAVRVWDVSNGELIHVLRGHDAGTMAMGVAVDDGIIVSAGGNTAVVWDGATGDCVMTLRGHALAVWAAAVGGGTVVTASADGTVRAWDGSKGDCVNVLDQSVNMASDVAVGEGVIASSGYGNSVRIWDAARGSSIRSLIGHSGAICDVAIGSGVIVSASLDETLRVWDAISGECINQLDGHTGPVFGVAIDGAVVASAGHDNTVRLWDVMSGELLGLLEVPIGRLRQVAVGDGIVAFSASDSSIRVWSADGGAGVSLLEGHFGRVRAVAIGGGLLASTSNDHTVRVWDADSGACVHVLEGHTGRTTSAAIADGIIASASSDQTLRVWDAESGECINVLEGHTNWVSGVAIGDGIIVSASADDTVRVWDVATGGCTTILDHLPDNGHATIKPEPFAVTHASDNAWEHVFASQWNPERRRYDVFPYEAISPAAP